MFKLKAFLPSQKKFIYVKELNYKTYRNLVKSLYVGDKLKTIELFNFILQEIIEVKELVNLTIIDKLAIFLTIREVCVSPDLNLKCTCPDSNASFNYQTAINDIQKTLDELITEVTVKTDNLTTKHSLFTGIKDETILLTENNSEDLCASITEIITEKIIKLDSYKFDEKKIIIEHLPASHLLQARLQIAQAKKHNSEKNLIKIVSPHTSKTIYKITGNIDSTALCELLEYLFIEELNNVYKAMYNVVTHCKFSAEYVDSITPAEIQVYWNYFLEENKKNTNTKNNPKTEHNIEFGF